jgi:hypothetical protein
MPSPWSPIYVPTVPKSRKLVGLGQPASSHLQKPASAAKKCRNVLLTPAVILVGSPSFYQETDEDVFAEN